MHVVSLSLVILWLCFSGVSTLRVMPVVSLPWLFFGYVSTQIITSGRRSPAVACWASDHWVASSNPLRGKFHH